MITVQELLDTDSLGLSVVAGAAGSHRLINWAYTVDLPDPWRWVSAGNLVMTTGGGIPRAPEEQWLEHLAQTNCSALVVAPHVGAPKLTKRLLDTAERQIFPVLSASFELEFVRLSHHVIESVLQAQRESLKASERLFQTYAGQPLFFQFLRSTMW